MLTITRDWDFRDAAVLHDESSSVYIHVIKMPKFHILSQETAINVTAGDFVAAVLCILFVLIYAGFHHA